MNQAHIIEIYIYSFARDTIRYINAPRSWQLAHLIYRTEPKNRC